MSYQPIQGGRSYRGMGSKRGDDLNPWSVFLKLTANSPELGSYPRGGTKQQRAMLLGQRMRAASQWYNQSGGFADTFYAAVANKGTSDAQAINMAIQAAGLDFMYDGPRGQSYGSKRQRGTRKAQPVYDDEEEFVEAKGSFRRRGRGLIGGMKNMRLRR